MVASGLGFAATQAFPGVSHHDSETLRRLAPTGVKAKEKEIEYGYRRSLHEAARLRFRFQMNNRLRLESLAAISRVFRDFGEPIRR